MLGLRSRGININTFNNIYKIDFKTKFKYPIELLIKEGLAALDDNRFYLTSSGYAVCDEILATYF